MRFYFQVRLLDPVIVSENTGTANPKALDHIPGSSMLGCVAAKLYATLDDTQAWQCFQNAQVRFGPCYLLHNQEIALPIPASWHFAKTDKEKVKIKNQYQSTVLVNHSQGEIDENKQYKQCRSGFITSTGYSPNIEQGQITKTALNRSTGGVEPSQLFIYQYLQAGQSFIGWIDCTTDEQKAQIEATLYGEQRIGHARGSEFGRVWISPVKITEPTAPKVKNTLTLWCLSDVQCLNELGLPTFTPTLNELIKEAKGTLDFAKSFIRQTRISRFNQKRGGLDSEQLCIAKGSVLVFKNVQINELQINELIEKGIGINRQQGLGWVSLEPAWMQGFSDNKAWFTPLQSDEKIEDVKLANASIKVPATTGLLTWLDRKISDAKLAVSIENNAEKIIQELLDAYSNARQFNRIPANFAAGPSSSQWARVMTVLRELSGHKELEDDHGKLWKDRLFIGGLSAKDSAICKATNDDSGWGVEWRTKNGGYLSFATFCQLCFTNYSATDLLKALEMLSLYDLSDSQSLALAKKQKTPRNKEPNA